MSSLAEIILAFLVVAAFAAAGLLAFALRNRTHETEAARLAKAELERRLAAEEVRASIAVDLDRSCLRPGESLRRYRLKNRVLETQLAAKSATLEAAQDVNSDLRERVRAVEERSGTCLGKRSISLNQRRVMSKNN